MKRFISCLIVAIFIFTVIPCNVFASSHKPCTSHVWATTYTVDKEATCNESGIESIHCTVCGIRNEDCELRTIEPLGHSYEKVIIKATEKKNGRTKEICTACNDTISDRIIYKPARIKFPTDRYVYNEKEDLLIYNCVYNGETIKPAIKVYDLNGVKINSSHYTVSYAKGRKNVGRYGVTVKFKSSSKKYKGSISTTFIISPKSTTISSITKGKKSFTVKWNKRSTQVTGYQIRYSTKSDMDNSKAKLLKSYKTTTQKVTGLKSNKKYYVQVRTYKTVNGVKYYSYWSNIKSVKTK